MNNTGEDAGNKVDADSSFEKDQDTWSGGGDMGKPDVGITADAGSEEDSGMPDMDIPAEKLILRDIKAFPTAAGYGAQATGGRGGQVLYVTTTEDSNSPGSLRWALEQDYPRIVYFLVGGTFTLNSMVYIGTGDLTIAGQTAHALGGVNIRGTRPTDDARLYFRDIENVIIRYISIEHGWGVYENDGSLFAPMTMRGVYNGIIDHYTGGWANYTGGGFGFANTNIGRGGMATTQYSLMHEGHAGQNVGGVGGIQMDWVRNTFPEAERAAIWRSWDGFSNHRNAFIGLTHRFFNTSGDGDVADQVYNNFIYGWNSRMSRHTNGNQPIDIYRNVYQAAQYNASVSYQLMHKFDFNDYYNLDPPISVAANFLLDENIIINKDGSIFQKVGDDNWPMLTQFSDSRYGAGGDAVDASARRTTLSPQPMFPIPMLPAEQVKEEVLRNVGSGVRFDENGEPSNVDPIDQRYIQWAKDGAGPTFTSRTKGDGGLGDSAEFVFPDYPSMTRAQDTLDEEGVPLDWVVPEDVDNQAGYSRLELYLADIAGDFHMLRRGQ